MHIRHKYIVFNTHRHFSVLVRAHNKSLKYWVTISKHRNTEINIKPKKYILYLFRFCEALTKQNKNNAQTIKLFSLVLFYLVFTTKYIHWWLLCYVEIPRRLRKRKLFCFFLLFRWLLFCRQKHVHRGKTTENIFKTLKKRQKNCEKLCLYCSY